MVAKMRLAWMLVVFLLLSRGVGAAEPVKIVCLGDSVTRAIRQGVTAEQTFCAQLEKKLTGAGHKVEVVNAGIGGNTTADGLRRFDADVLARQPRYVVIMFGLNDSWIDDGRSTSRLTVDQYRANLRKMIDTLGERKIDIVLMTPNPAVAPMYPPARNQTLKPYVEAVHELGREYRLPVIDVYGRFAELSIEGVDINTLFTDAMHPNPAGQEMIAEMLAGYFGKRLEK